MDSNNLIRQESQNLAKSSASDLVKSRIIVAQKIPRDLNKTRSRIQESLADPDVAKEAIYSLPRKAKDPATGQYKTVHIIGLSISIIKELAREFGHIDYGASVLEVKGTIASMHAHCTDLQNNVRAERNWQVVIPARVMKSKNQSEEIYKFCLMEGVKRTRSCIEQVLPEHLKKFAAREIEKSLQTGKAALPSDRFKKMIDSFSALDSRITEPHVFQLLGKTNKDQLVEEDFNKLLGVYNSIKDRVANIFDHFPAIGLDEERAEMRANKELSGESDFYSKLPENKES